MPINPTNPGVYIEELPTSVRAIAGVPTSITAFIGRTRSGPVNKPVTITAISARSIVSGLKKREGCAGEVATKCDSI